MRFSHFSIAILASVTLWASSSQLLAEQPAAGPIAAAELPDAPQAQEAPASTSQTAKAQTPAPAAIPLSKQQPKRILGLMPNYRAVSAGQIPPPPTPRQAFKIATENSFDYSSFIFVGITSLLAEGSNAHPALGKGVDGFGRYYWRGYLDKTDGNYLVIWALPSVLHEDERYYAKGDGSLFDRALYSSSRVLIAKDYHGRNIFNASEIFGRGIAQGVSLSYYPSSSRTVGSVSEKYVYSLGRDAITNTFREFWPDIATHILHRHP